MESLGHISFTIIELAFASACVSYLSTQRAKPARRSLTAPWKKVPIYLAFCVLCIYRHLEDRHYLLV